MDSCMSLEFTTLRGGFSRHDRSRCAADPISPHGAKHSYRGIKRLATQIGEPECAWPEVAKTP